jgi:hypothetical protein
VQAAGGEASLIDSWLSIGRFIDAAGLEIPEFYLDRGQGVRRKFRDPRKALSAGQVLEEIRADNSNGYLVRGGRKRQGAVDLDEETTSSVIRAMLTEKGKGLLELSFASIAESRPDWQSLILDLHRSSGIVYASTVLGQYSAWQNCTDVGSYERFYGPSTARPKIKTDVLGDLVEEIDTSLNPGRGERGNAGPMAVGAEMWFGEAFWSRYQVDKNLVLRALTRFEPREVDGSIYLKSYETDFDQPDGEQGEIQKLLWQVLFNRETSW